MPFSQPTPSEVMQFEQRYAALANFLACWFPENDLDGIEDRESARQFAEISSPLEIRSVLAEGDIALRETSIRWREMGHAANRPFEGAETARDWLRQILGVVKATFDDRPQ